MNLNNIKSDNYISDTDHGIYKETIEYTKMLFQEMTEGRLSDIRLLNMIIEKIHMNEKFNIIRCLSDNRCIDEYTYVHSVNVALYSKLIAKCLKLPKCEVNKAIISGLLHDIGKMKIPETILNKNSRLRDKEFDIIKKHTILGHEIISSLDMDEDIKKAVLLHHERLDGSGYPLGYYSEDLNLYSRIVSIADVFDAMTSDRVYKSRCTPFEAFEMFQTSGNCLFDDKLVAVFIKHLSCLLEGAKVLLSNGKIGEIVSVPQNKSYSPIIQYSDNSLILSKDSLVRVVKII